MRGKNVLVTGASGFIGLNLVQQLVKIGCQVTCLVRKQSNVEALKKLGCRLVINDINGDIGELDKAVSNQDVVFHLAAMTNAPNKRRQQEVNVGGVRNLLSRCVRNTSPPVVVLVSSVAAAGPNRPEQPHQEADPCQPVSDYGKSKRDAELVAAEFASQVEISIVRPPIVLGPRDREGLILFRTIRRFRSHIVPGFVDHRFSVIHADDLVQAMIAIADRGQRIIPQSRLDDRSVANGIYFASADEVPTYAELGNMVARAVDVKNLKTLHVPTLAVWALATVNSTLNYLFGRAEFFNRDKAREATAGSWTCSNEKIKQELDWSPAFPLAERLEQTAQWYRQHGWLPAPADPHTARSQQTRHVPDESF